MKVQLRDVIKMRNFYILTKKAFFLFAVMVLEAVWGSLKASETINLTRSNRVNSGDDKGKVVVTTTHAKFTLSSEGYDIDNGDDGGLRLVQTST